MFGTGICGAFDTVLYRCASVHLRGIAGYPSVSHIGGVHGIIALAWDRAFYGVQVVQAAGGFPGIFLRCIA